MQQVYLDNHSSTKLDARVYEAMLPFLKDFYGNPQSLHSFGYKSYQAIENARNQLAQLINAQSEEIIFTSCGSEANNLAIKGIAQAYQTKGKHIIISAIEHISILNAVKRLQKDGFEISYLPVDKYGVVSPTDLKNIIRNDTILISIQHANPEIGTIQNLTELVKIAHENKILFHTDAIATVGIIPVDVKELDVDLLSLAGSQFYGPKGAAALYIRKGVKIVPQIDGGIQEFNRRAGLENVPAIVGMGKAAEIAKKEMIENNNKIIKLRDRIMKELPKLIEYIYLNGHPTQRLPNNINFSIEFIEGEGILLLLDEKGIYVSSGSACTSKQLKMSHVLSAIGVDAAIGQGSITMTLSKFNTSDDINYLLEVLPPIVTKLRDLSPLYAHFLKTGKRQDAGPGTDYDHHHHDINT